MLMGGKRPDSLSGIAVETVVQTTRRDLSRELHVLKRKCVSATGERGLWRRLLSWACCYCNKTPEAHLRREGLCWPIGSEVLGAVGWPIPFEPAVRQPIMGREGCMMENPSWSLGSIKTHRGPDSTLSRTLTQGHNCLS